MQINSKLTKPLTEVKYLTAENCSRYRTILRYFYLQYEKIKYWMYREEIYEELVKYPFFSSYSLELCQHDLDALVEWGNLIPMQDTSKASTVEEFKNKKFRYQLSEYSVEIERLTIKLENINVEGASLEPTLLERIKDHIIKIRNMVHVDSKAVGIWWRDLSNDFIRLNQNYQDYVRSFYSQKAEELMKTREFIAYKDALIDYLREFVKELQKNMHFIEAPLREATSDEINIVLAKVLEYEKSIPRLDVEVSDETFIDNINGKWESIQDWFLGSANKESEASKIFDITNEVIRKITRYASQISENRGSGANRKEEYRKLCELFLSCRDMEEAHKLSSVAFGIFNTKHIRSGMIRSTESINSSVYDEQPDTVEIRPKIRGYREKSARSAIENKSERKKEILDQHLRTLVQEKSIIDSYIKDKAIKISELPIIKPHVRITLLRWISKACANENKSAKTDDGRVFKLIGSEDKSMCMLRCEDGNLEMPSYTILFE